MKEDTWVHSICEMCVADCGILVHRVDGLVVDIKGDPDCPNSRGKTCAKAYAAIMHLYDPNRVKRPLQRTNPEKGLGIDPGWAPVSWEEAMSILEEKLAKVRKEDPRKLAITTFDSGSSVSIIPNWAKAFGTPNSHWIGYYCGQYLHSSMYLTNGTFHCDFDTDYINYLILIGNQAGFGAGLNPNITAQKVAEARKKRGLKVVVIDPICTPAASKADEWVPIRPGTDAALMLAMINVLINDSGLYDLNFIKKRTNGPYLVKADGYYLRQDGKPLVWDGAAGKAKPYDADVQDYATEGSFTVDGTECRPAFQLLKEHVSKYTPAMAAAITTVPATTIYRLAEEFGREARIGSTIVVEGTEFPYRPVAANIYRGAGAHEHGVAGALGVQILNMVVGNFYVPGGHRGMNLVGPAWEWQPGVFDGLVVPTTNPELGAGNDYYNYKIGPPDSMELKELYPMSTNRAPMHLATSIEPEKYKLPYHPEVLLTCRRNLFMGGCDYKITAEALRKYRFIASFCVTLDEMSDFADLVLPEAIGLEKLQFMPNRLTWSHTAQTGYFYWGVRQPVVAPLGEARDWADVLMELADRIGFLGDVYENFNHRFSLKGPYKLDPAQKYTKEEIGDRRFKAKFGEERGLAWFKEYGFHSIKRTVDELYPLPWLKVRFPLYYENFLEAGGKVKAVAQSIGLNNWDISDYEALPEWKACGAGHPTPEGFDLTACNFRVATHSMSWTAENPWLAEVAELNPYAQKILINTLTARKRGINDKDRVYVESSV
ncbi:MAG: molybdopterin-dependent oxidoreductase, partial [Pseudomonadota bacterium]